MRRIICILLTYYGIEVLDEKMVRVAFADCQEHWTQKLTGRASSTLKVLRALNNVSWLQVSYETSEGAGIYNPVDINMLTVYAMVVIILC